MYRENNTIRILDVSQHHVLDNLLILSVDLPNFRDSGKSINVKFVTVGE